MSKIKQAVKHTGRGRKEQIVAELVKKLDNSNGLVFADYKGLTHKQLENLKKELKKLDSTMIVAKNSLLKLSLGKSQKYANVKDNERLNLPTAAVFIQGDMVEPLKKIAKAIKDFGLPKIKFGILEGNLTDEAEVLKIASLPNRETLLIQLVGTLNSPISGLVIALNSNIQKFVMTLDAVAKNKPVSNTAQASQTEAQTITEPAASGQELEADSAEAGAKAVAGSTEPDQTTTQPDQPTPAITGQPTEETKSETSN